MFHYLINEGEGVCGASMSGQVASSSDAVFGSDIIVLAVFGLIAVVARRGTAP